MQITPIGYTPAAIDLTRSQPAAKDGTGTQFADMLGDYLRGVSGTQSQADNLAMRLATGDDVDVHDAVLATEEASLAFQYTLQVRNKLVDAYQEVMRMQV